MGWYESEDEKYGWRKKKRKNFQKAVARALVCACQHFDAKILKKKTKRK